MNIVYIKGAPFAGTKEEYDQLPSDGKFNCPECGLNLTEPCPGCGCPTVSFSGRTDKGFVYTAHINKYHHNCDRAWEHAYGRRNDG